jgi:hypothetical protein
MSHKHLAFFAVLMVVVFGGIVVLYPRIFSSDRPPITSPDRVPLPPESSPVVHQ